MLAVRARVTYGGRLEEGHRAIRAGLLMALLILTYSLLNATEPTPPTDQAKPDRGLKLQSPPSASDWPRTTTPIATPLRNSQPTLLELPDFLDDPIPSGSDPLAEPSLIPARLLIRGPRLQSPSNPKAPTNSATDPSPDLPLVDPLVQPAPLPIDQGIPEQPLPPQAPEAVTFTNPQLQAPPPVPPEVFGVPYPIQGPAELAPYARVRLARRYNLELRAVLSGLYDDAALLVNNGQKSDYILSIVPEIALAVGSDQSPVALRVAYDPLINWYTQGTNKDGVNHNAQFAALYKSKRLQLGATGSISTSISGGSLDTGPVSESETYLAALTSVYNFTGKISMDSTFDETILKYSGSNNSDETRLQAFGNYQVGNFKLGIGTLVGLLDSEGQSSQHYIQSLGRVIYAPLVGKLAFNAAAGYEIRDLGGGRGRSYAPVFQIAATYQLFPRTTLILGAQRHIYASNSTGSSGENYSLTSFDGMIRQGFNGYGRNFFISLAGGLQCDRYSGGSSNTNRSPSAGSSNFSSPSILATGTSSASTFATSTSTGSNTSSGNGNSSGGEDDFFYTRVSFDWAMREHCTLGAFYEYSEDTSNRQSGMNFKRNRVGLQITVIFF